MTLKEYLDALPRGGKSKFAKKIGCSLSMLSQMAGGNVSVPLRLAKKITEAAGGKLSLADLIPDLAEST